MRHLDLMREAAALAGYSIDGSGGQDVSNKTRSARRVNMIKADVISRYGGKWDANYREGWLPLVPKINLTASFTPLSPQVDLGLAGTDAFSAQYLFNGFPTTIIGAKILGPDGNYYKICGLGSATNTTAPFVSLQLTQPYQGVDTNNAYAGNTGNVSTFIWIDEYVLYPEVLSVGGFLDYQWQATMDETWPRNMKQSYPFPQNTELPTVYTVIGRKTNVGTYSVGTISGSVNDTMLVGVGTFWLANVQPGYEILIGSTYYHVKTVLSNTSIELYQRLTSTIAASAYTAKGKNALIIRFREPTSQKVVHYWYWAKDYPFVNDSDEDWVAEQFPRVIINGMAYFDYVDKNDVARATTSHTIYEDSIKNMKVATDSAMSGPRTLGYNIPPEARD